MAKKNVGQDTAFVPVEEQPYSVPENWRWACGDSIFLLPESKRPDGETFRYIDIDSIDNSFQCVREAKLIKTENAPSRAKRKIDTGDTIFSLVRPYLKNIAYIDESLSDCIASTGFYVCRPSEFLNSRYLYWLMISPYVVDGLNRFMKGDNSPSIKVNNIRNYKYPLPPLAEQQRIVDRIESLFAKLDEAKEKAQAALDSFESRQSAILDAAFSGKLTTRWRNSHSRENRWKQARFDEIAKICCNLVDPYEYQDFPHIAPDNIEKKTGRLLDYHTIEEDGVKSGKHLFHSGQILYSKIRPYLSKVITVDFDGLCSADMYPIEPLCNRYFLWYEMLSDRFLNQASCAGSRSVLPKINQKELSGLMVAVTDDADEQQEIVRILDNFFAREADARQQVESTLTAIETMKKAIFAKAFRGELGTNYPEEDACDFADASL
ncbi:MAG: restriction endonuclease subunit S [Clostridiales bacterium]|nr:restriction endonuclease subunit S [Clostridiales bacterium]